MNINFETIQFAVKDGICTITINRPKALNALNELVLTELTKAFRDIRREGGGDGIQGVILTGAGDKAFVAGADISSMPQMTVLQAEYFVELGHRCMRAVETCRVPVIAAVNGFALGGGLELALSCDFIYAASSAKLGLPEVNLGIFPGFGGTQRLARLIGRNRAKELIFTARILSAQEAFDIGIINKVCEPAQLIDETTKTLQTIMKKGPIGVHLAKKVINEGTDLPLESGLKLEEMTFPMIFGTEDKTEGVRAFLEKREAKFAGK
ncbi:MAG: enoyl-CoA hydratase/isomerase family protein [Deltaproteobacteria bacterium]|nr:enoyl-CoA hydratase/isomerase family protein [Deltaproteobacteria bacterium]